jgi:LmbE family N-acetylglucosaminyl deacetylase
VNILAIGAHFDDVELGCGGALAKHAKDGDDVYVYVATLSGFADYNNRLVRSNEIALAEARAAMKILGVRDLICGQFKALQVEFGDELNSEILRIVDERKIERVYTHWIADIHHDHRALARASLHSCRHVPRLLMYRSNWYESAENFRGNFYIDVTTTWPQKEKAIRAHASEMSRIGERWLRYFRNEAENAGQRAGVQLAEAFDVVKWLEP